MTTIIVNSQRKAPKLHHEGFIYNRCRADGFKTTWRCEKYNFEKCRGRAISSGEVVIMAANHNHGPSPILSEVARVSQALKASASTSTETARTLALRSMEGVSEPALVLMPKMESLQKAVAASVVIRSWRSLKVEQTLTYQKPF
ncbi:uncharacterized protein LOC129906773 [Episyrphus balteatus]|uniref:uncharacterized protein LOC129906773 n=1 Tax=Episyrphus balteatus TaxID=286459 RepID=UPI00248613C9|nr:uncharacterized protein LOC129906773 [Episyrphus balteatus]